MNKLHVKRDDTVVVISGDDKGLKGKVLEVSPKEGKVIVEGANIQTKHNKARRQGEESSIIKVEGAMYASKVQIYCPNCKKGVRVAHKTEAGKDGKNVKIRVCAKCGKEL